MASMAGARCRLVKLQSIPEMRACMPDRDDASRLSITSEYSRSCSVMSGPSLVFEQRPLLRDVSFGRVAHHPCDRHFFLVSKRPERVVDLWWKADRGTRRPGLASGFSSPFCGHGACL